MLIPISLYQVSKIVPSVATGGQFKYALGDPRKILQRVIISSIGGVITFLISVSQDRNQTYSLWLLLCVLFFLYILWGPILEASKKNLNFLKFIFFLLASTIGPHNIYKKNKTHKSNHKEYVWFLSWLTLTKKVITPPIEEIMSLCNIFLGLPKAYLNWPPVATEGTILETWFIGIGMSILKY